MTRSVGLIGIGLMGSALAQRLMDAGYAVLGFDHALERREALQRMGGIPVASGAEVGRRSDQVLIAVLTAEQVEQVVEGTGGLLASGRPLTVLCTATCDPETITSLAARTAARGITFLDTPVSGSSAQVLQGAGLGLISGDPAAVERCAGVIEAIYPRHVLVGSVGNASRAKLAINLALGLNRAALAEALVFSEQLGLDPTAFLTIARQSAAYSQIMDVKGTKMVSGDFRPQGRIAQSRKDLRLILNEAERRGQRLPLTETLLELLDGCANHGEDDLDNSAIIREVRRRRAR